MAKRKIKSKNTLPKHLQHINVNAAGIDVGSKSHFVAVPVGRDKESVKEFDSYTTGLNEWVAWLKKCDIDTVAMGKRIFLNNF